MVLNSNGNDVVPPVGRHWISPEIAFLLVSFSLGELGDGLNIFQGIYLVGTGWNEGSVGVALSLMGLTALIVQPWAGDWVDKTTVDRRIFLCVASVVTAVSASSVLLVRPGNQDHTLIFVSKIIEGVAASFIGPCLAALTLGCFGPHRFDHVMAQNILYGHVGSVVAAILAGAVAYGLYPNVKYCFLVIGASAIFAVLVVPFLPVGDALMGRGFAKTRTDDESTKEPGNAPVAVSYWDTFTNPQTCLLCLTGFFFHFANANVLLVLGELMGQEEEGTPKRSAIPLIAGAIVLAQLTMAAATAVGSHFTHVGRKPLFLAGLVTLPVRCAMILLCRDWGDSWLLSTQILDGLGGGFFGLLHPLLVADITFGSGRFNVVMGLTASCFGIGATLSNFLGQVVVEHYGHVASLMGSLVLSVVPIGIFWWFPETLGQRCAPEVGSDYRAIV